MYWAEYFRGVKKDQSDLNLRNWNLGRYKAKKAVENFQKGRGFFRKSPSPFGHAPGTLKKIPVPFLLTLHFIHKTLY